MIRWYEMSKTLPGGSHSRKEGQRNEVKEEGDD